MPRVQLKERKAKPSVGESGLLAPARFGMSDEIDTAARYRQRAKGLRQIASDKSALGIRNQLLTLAEDYERLASMLEDIDATNVAMKRDMPGR